MISKWRKVRTVLYSLDLSNRNTQNTSPTWIAHTGGWKVWRFSLLRISVFFSRNMTKFKGKAGDEFRELDQVLLNSVRTWLCHKLLFLLRLSQIALENDHVKVRSKMKKNAETWFFAFCYSLAWNICGELDQTLWAAARAMIKDQKTFL